MIPGLDLNLFGFVCVQYLSSISFIPSFLCTHFLYVHICFLSICVTLSITVRVVHFPSVHTCMCVSVVFPLCVCVYVCRGMLYAGIVGGGSLWSQQYPGGGEGTKVQCQRAGPDALSGRGSAIPVNKCIISFIYILFNLLCKNK